MFTLAAAARTCHYVHTCTTLQAIDKVKAKVQSKSSNTTSYVSTMSSAHKCCPVMLSQTSTYQQVHHRVPAFYELTHYIHGVRPVYRRASSTMLPGEKRS